jgi:hypothetical protein
MVHEFVKTITTYFDSELAFENVTMSEDDKKTQAI